MRMNFDKFTQRKYETILEILPLEKFYSLTHCMAFTSVSSQKIDGKKLVGIRENAESN